MYVCIIAFGIISSFTLKNNNVWLFHEMVFDYLSLEESNEKGLRMEGKYVEDFVLSIS